MQGEILEAVETALPEVGDVVDKVEEVVNTATEAAELVTQVQYYQDYVTWLWIGIAVLAFLVLLLGYKLYKKK